MENLKILFWVVAIGLYIYTQLKDSLKKDDRTDSIPKMPSIPGMNTQRAEPKQIRVPVNTYTPTSQVKPSKRYQSKYNKAEEIRRSIEGEESNPKEKYAQGAFYKDEPAQLEERKSLFGVDQHLKPYELHGKEKHPLMTFLSNKSNLKNAFITGEILKRPE